MPTQINVRNVKMYNKLSKTCHRSVNNVNIVSNISKKRQYTPNQSRNKIKICPKSVKESCIAKICQRFRRYVKHMSKMSRAEIMNKSP